MDDLIQDFVAETLEGLEALDSELVRFEQAPENPQLLGEVFRLIHTIKGTCGFIGLVRLQGLAHAAETVLGGFRDASVAVTAEAVSAVLETVDVIRSLVEGLARDGVELVGDDTALVGRLEMASRVSAVKEPMSAPSPVYETTTGPAPAAGPLLARLGGEASLDAACEMAIGRFGASPALAEALGGVNPDRLQASLRDGLCAAARGFGGADHFAGQIRGLTGDMPSPALIAAVSDLVGESLVALDIAPTDVDALMALVMPGTSGAAPIPASAPALARLEIAPTPARPAPTAEPVAAQTIRVSVEALENTMTVVSELVLIRNQLLQLVRLDPESAFAGPLSRLNQVTSELQEGVMTTRMQPINGAWAKLPRLVRDLANDLGKKIDLTLRGQDTELDRQVLELIKDPLTHMVRNAADHGIEGPAERLAAGKPETGRISLSARHEGGAIVIEMSDDGRGLSASKIRTKAISSGLVTEAQAETMSDAEARQLVFLPGFSTAAEVTAVSGRGVGMDVVRTNIEKIGGVVELTSVEGAGTRFTIHIPLTLAIISALIVECHGERFAMPQSSVVELVSASDASGRTIEYINGAAVLRLRDRLLPLVSLETLLGLSANDTPREETCIVVASVGAFSFGVIVDRVFDTEEIVVKPVASVLRNLKIYSGATILGDGAVIMILDFKGMSLETGSGRSGVSIEEESDIPTQVGVARADVLLFRAADDTFKGAPLGEVSRIEEVDSSQIEWVDGRSVVQYRGQLMPVVGADGNAIARSVPGGLRPLLVFVRDDRSAGLLVDEIIDIVQCAMVSDLTPSGPGSLGSLIIAERATELIDVDYYWRRAIGTEEPTVLRPSDRAASDGPRHRRLLVVDASPFSQVLLAPLLAQAGYDVSVAEDPEAALRLHDAGERFDLIMADTLMNGPDTKRFVTAFQQAANWGGTPLLSLAMHKPGAAPFNATTILDAVSGTLEPDTAAFDLRGAA